MGRLSIAKGLYFHHTETLIVRPLTKMAPGGPDLYANWIVKEAQSAFTLI